LSAQAAQYLVAKKIRALGTDLPSIARFDDVEARLTRGLPAEEVWAEHLPLFQAGIPIIAGLVNLDAILKEPNVAFVGFPLALAVGDGSPIRATALVF
jgi:kynurenine formamidase